jgi:hypothetical protein
MRLTRGSTHLLMAAAFLCAAFGVSAFAQSQAATTAGQQGQNSSPEPQASDPNASKSEEQPQFSPFTIISTLIFDVRGEDHEIEELIEKGQKPWFARRNYSKLMQIIPDEEQVMLTICRDAQHRLDGVDAEMTEIQRESRDAVGVGHKDDDPERNAKWKELNEQHPKIYEETINNLRQALGDETFNKVSAWIVTFELAPEYGHRRVAQPSKPADSSAPRAGASGAQP